MLQQPPQQKAVRLRLQATWHTLYEVTSSRKACMSLPACTTCLAALQRDRGRQEGGAC